jgi:phosphoribosylformylglycinamidine synthase
LLDDLSKSMNLAFKKADEAILLIGENGTWLSQSSFLATILGREEGAPPPVDLERERRTGDLVRSIIGERLVTAAHDLSDGGLLVAIAEMAMASGIGAELDPVPAGLPNHAFWFGEDQARYVVTAALENLPKIEKLAANAGVKLRLLGRSRGKQLTVSSENPILVSSLQARHESWLPEYMGSPA